MSILLTGVGVDLDPATLQWLAQLGTRPSFVTISAVNTFIRQCKADGNWTLLDRFWLFAQDVQANAKVSIPNPTSTQITEVNAPAWSANNGYTSNGTTSYLNSNYNPSTNGVNYVQNSGSIHLKIQTNTASGVQVEMGVGDMANVNPGTWIWSRAFTNLSGLRINGNTTLTAANADASGFYQSIRNASNARALYMNGVLLSSDAAASTGLPNGNIYIGCVLGTNTGQPVNFSDRQISLAGIGSGAMDVVKFYNAISALATSIGF
jgi:hypothetical protein